MLKICPISSGSVASKASCISFVYSIRKRNVKIYVRQKPKYQPVPIFSGIFLWSAHNYAAIIIRQHNNWFPVQIWTEDTFA